MEGSDTVAVDCFGNTVIDQENMGTLVYTPDPGYKVTQTMHFQMNQILKALLSIHSFIDISTRCIYQRHELYMVPKLSSTALL